MEIFLYLLKVSAGLVAFYAVYWLLLRHHTYFTANRFYLLVAIFGALVAPFFEISEQVPAVVAAAPLNLDALTIAATTDVNAVQKPDLAQILCLLYAAGIAFMLIRLGKKLGQILRIIKLNKQERVGQYVLVRTENADFSSFSFLNYLVISTQDEANYAEVVLRHEAVHIRQRHSLDLLLLELVHAFFWFNPILILYKRSLKQVHEFIADELATAGDRLTYARTLVGYTFGVSPQVLTNNFFDSSQIKNRIVMLTKNRSSRWVLARYLLALPALGALVLLVAARTVEIIPASAPETPVESFATAPAPLVLDTENMQITPAADKVLVTGNVFNKEDKTPMPGANVVVIGETKGTTTDANGNFMIETTDDKELAVSFIGFQTAVVSLKKMKAKDKIAVSIGLEKDSKELPELVVTSLTPARTNTDSPNIRVPVPPVVTKEGEVFMVVEQSPEFLGGTSALMQFLAKNIRYPAAAARANVQGKVFMQFVVSKEGKIRDLRVLQGIGFGCDEEAVRVASIMPDWKPGQQNGQNVAVQYNLPINFILESRDGSPTKPENTRFIINGLKEGQQPLMIVDGVEIKLDADSIKLDPKNIESMEVIKNEAATKTYGEKGKYGVIFITTKKKAAQPKN
jgi:TonB family protein